MVTNKNQKRGSAIKNISRGVSKRNDTAVRLSRWLDDEIELYISDRKVKVEFPSKRNFVDTAVMQLLEEKGVNLSR